MILRIALLLAMLAGAASSPAPRAGQGAVFRRTCADCDVDRFCEYGFPGTPRGHVACVDSDIELYAKLYRRYDAPRCGPGQLDCTTYCVANSSIDANDCGTCGNNCTAIGGGQVCVAGTCECPGGGEVCDDLCRDTTSDNIYCGDCVTSCDAGQTCTNSKCECDSGTLCDPDGCVDTNDNQAHCGECGTECGAWQICMNGECLCDGSGLDKCGTACFNILEDPAHCGGCNRTCAGSCVSGSCDPN
ncbi:hypothetical protein DFJ74DRAFT_692071 [Hyaloraphidium curvatum]|nr:hypothetical protein DFJ74DRAFT_692071 [Hyaloraphidium curvatum]